MMTLGKDVRSRKKTSSMEVCKLHIKNIILVVVRHSNNNKREQFIILINLIPVRNNKYIYIYVCVYIHKHIRVASIEGLISALICFSAVQAAERERL